MVLYATHNEQQPNPLRSALSISFQEQRLLFVIITQAAGPSLCLW